MTTITDSAYIIKLTRYMQGQKHGSITLQGLDKYADAFIKSDEFCDAEGDVRH